MGVSGCGKSTIGEKLALQTGGTFTDGDGLHPPENVDKMSAGIALTDADRWPWLARVRDVIHQASEDAWTIVACSALKRAYRDFLRSGTPALPVVYLCGTQDNIAARLSARKGHFMPPGLLDSQFRTLEPPQPDEGILTVSIEPGPDAVVSSILEGLRHHASRQDPSGGA